MIIVSQIHCATWKCRNIRDKNLFCPFHLNRNTPFDVFFLLILRVYKQRLFHPKKEFCHLNQCKHPIWGTLAMLTSKRLSPIPSMRFVFFTYSPPKRFSIFLRSFFSSVFSSTFRFSCFSFRIFISRESIFFWSSCFASSRATDSWSVSPCVKRGNPQRSAAQG